MTRVLDKFNLHNLSIPRKFPTHDHLLYSTTKHGPCAGCSEEKDLPAEFYKCLECNIFFHKECIESAIEINHPFHPQHSLWLVNRDNLPDNSDQKCSLCKEDLMLLVYCCLICDFKLNMPCAKSQPLFQIDQPKVDKHTLHLLLKNVSFICDACGLEGDKFPYVCVTCNLMFHIHCVYFPHESHHINVHQDIRKVRALDEHHHLFFHKHGEVDDVSTRYDACKFEKILQNYSKPIEPNDLFECLPNNLRPSSAGEGSGEKSQDPHHKSLQNTKFTIPTIIISMVLPLLHDLAHQMIKAGHQQQLFKSYRDIRGAVLEQSLQKLGVERFSKKDVQRMKWEVLEAKVLNWIHYMRISVKQLFALEKKIFDQIFDDVESLKDQSFAEVIANNFAMLLSFGDAITKCKRSPEKLFALLDMYEIMRELQPEFELIFGSKPCTEIKESTMNLTKRLAQTAEETFLDFVERVDTDGTKTVVMDGSIHPLTRYVVNYIKYFFVVSEHGNSYLSTLSLFFQEFESVDPHTKMKSMLMRIIQALQNNLDCKSKQYKDEALAQLFLMNNVYYILRSIRRSEAYDLLGVDWVQIHRRIVQQHANQYKRVSWAKIFECLNYHLGEGGSIENLIITKTLVKDKFKHFNSQFEELHQRQCQWSVPDSALRESLRLSVSECILPAFRSFLKRFGPMINSGKNPHKYIRFSLEDVERMLNELFRGQNLE